MQFRRPRASRAPERTWTRDEVVWGIPLREGLSDDDDPSAHQGVAQHAFEIGTDEKAVCGFEPPKRSHPAYPTPRPRLGLPSPAFNPRCTKCAALVLNPEPEAAAADEKADSGPVAQAGLEPTLEPAVEPAVEPRRMARPAATGRDRATEPGAAKWLGSLTIPPGTKSMAIEAANVVGGQIAARVVDGPPDVAVDSVTMVDGSPTIILTAVASVPVTVSWMILPDLG